MVWAWSLVLLSGVIFHAPAPLPMVLSNVVAPDAADAHAAPGAPHAHDWHEHSPSSPQAHCHPTSASQTCCLHAMRCCVLLPGEQFTWRLQCQGALTTPDANSRSPHLRVPRQPPRLARS